MQMARPSFDLDVLPAEGPAARAHRALPGYDVVVVGVGAHIPPLAGDHHTRAVQLLECSNVSLDAAAARAAGVAVADVAEALAPTVAAYAVALILAGLQRPFVGGQRSRSDVVRHAGQAQAAELLRGKTVGIVGLGRVGEQLARIVAPLGARVLFSDLRTAPSGLAGELGLRRVTLDRLLTLADVVSLHVSPGPTASPLLRRRELALMSATSLLVSTSDSRVLDIPALLSTLAAGVPGCAALDIQDGAPDRTGAPAANMARTQNLLVTDAAASDTPAADELAARFAVSNVVRALDGQALESVHETVGPPANGDPAFWSSYMYPRRRQEGPAPRR